MKRIEYCFECNKDVEVIIKCEKNSYTFREKEFISKDKNYEEIEEAKRKKNQRRAKMVEFFHINEIKHFFDKLFAPVTKLINASKARKEKKELEIEKIGL